MVQRKAPDKIGIQADAKNHVKSKKQSTGLNPSSQNPDMRNKGGPELKKMMKKSRSIKRSEFDNMRSNSMKQGAKSRLDKPPSEVVVAAVTPQKPPPLKIPEASPNYMKSTSSSIARKERSQVSPYSSKTSCDSKSPGWKDSKFQKLSSGSSHKQGKTLTKTSSLRPVRTLTKASSTKTGRTSMKNSGIGLCSDQKVRKATCSSTLKDSKFPAYVMLHTGGTESEGTSVMKVCPYTYCSLNGHHHAQLPPLRCFLSARRHLLKTQKSMRLKNLSSVSRERSGKRKKNINTGRLVINGEPANLESDLVDPAISPLKEVGLDFFVEIYAPAREDTTESMGRSTDDGNDDAKKDFNQNSPGLENISYEDGAGTGAGAGKERESDGGRYAESIPDESSRSTISFEDNIDFSMEEMDTAMFFPEHIQQEEAEDKDHPPCYTQADTSFGGTSGSEYTESEVDESISDGMDMDWEEGQVVDAPLDNEADCFIFTGDEHTDTRFKIELIFKPDDTVSNCHEEVPANEELQVVHAEEIFNEDLAEESDFESNGDQTSMIDVSNGVTSEESDTLNSRSLQEQHHSNEDVDEKTTAIDEKKDGEPDPNEFITIGASSDPAEYTLEEPTAAFGEICGISEPENDFVQGYVLLEDEKSMCNTHAGNEPQLEEQEQYSLESETDHGTVSQNPHADAEETEDKDFQLKSQIYKSVESETHQGVSTSSDLLVNALNENVDDEAEKKEQVEDACSWIGIQISGGCQVSSEAKIEADNKDQLEGKGLSISSSTFPEGYSSSEGNKSKFVEDSRTEDANSQVEDKTGAEEITTINAGCRSDQQQHTNCSNFNKPIRCKRPIKESEEPRMFNPRGPRFLPLELGPDPEKVDLRHHLMDERKNAEEWMVDFALRQAVTKLAPARKRKVALLVEAFETVIPLPNYEIHLPHTPTGFTHTRFMQACS